VREKGGLRTLRPTGIAAKKKKSGNGSLGMIKRKKWNKKICLRWPRDQNWTQRLTNKKGRENSLNAREGKDKEAAQSSMGIEGEKVKTPRHNGGGSCLRER